MPSANAPSSASDATSQVRECTEAGYGQAKALIEQLAFEGRHVPPEDVQRPAIVPQEIVGLAQEALRDDLEADIPEGPQRWRGRARLRRWRGHSPLYARNGGSCRRRPTPAAVDRPAPGRGSRLGAGVRGSAYGLRAQRAHCAGRTGDRWPARWCHDFQGDAAAAPSACSKHATASR